MFVGHYAGALVAKAIEPRAPLWSYVLACQAVDIAWGGLIIAGVEKVSVDHSLPGSALVLSHMPYSHSLPAAVLWSVGVATVLAWLLKLPRRAGLFIGLAVLSHWLLDFLVHRPDLPLLWTGPKVGLGLWNHAVLEQAVEMGLLAMAAASWAWRRGREGLGWGGPVVFLGVLLVLQVVPLLTPLADDPVGLGSSAIATYLAVGLVAFLAEFRTRKD
ncbi:hypothetical protein J2X45_002421 [Caulobacter sp. BE264]|uniref:hypothetical protein n=1 Tax=Caulobacter sp. BE264 TaxID=2817724 RepID=UPI00285A5D50|nr:hypothetical protein [Caulobacter sp. BE264]MDR7231326.1 hypothetical protein [Caulobacter sp. BE264]